MRSLEKRTIAVPTYHDATGRWCQKIGYKHGRTGDRTRAWFYWPGEKAAHPPAEIIAASVSKQNEWSSIVEEWETVRPLLESLDDEGLCWILPIWFDRAILSSPLDAADELKAAKIVVANHESHLIVQQLKTVESWGHNSDNILSNLRAAGILPNSVIVATKKLTVRQAITTYLKQEKQRIEMKAGNRIKTGTYNTKRNNLLICIGCTIAVDWQQNEPNLIDLEKPLTAIESSDLQRIAHHWFRLPGNVRRRTVANYFSGLKSFLAWADRQDELGFMKPKATDHILRISGAETTDVTPTNLNLLKMAISDETDRNKLFALLQLICGFNSADISNLELDEVQTIEGEMYITGYRSKEDSEAKIKSKIKTTHWIPPELAKIMHAQKAEKNEYGLYFLNAKAKPLASEKVEGGKFSAIAKAWEKVRAVHPHRPTLKQLRKWGWNEIQKYGGDRVCAGETLARRWAGQQGGGVAKSYRFDDYRPVIAAQKLWWKAVKSKLGF